MLFVAYYYLGSIPVKNELCLASNESKSYLISRVTAVIHGYPLCTGLIIKEELQAVMLGGSWQCVGSWLSPLPLKWCKIVPPLTHLICEEYKHSASVQSLLITPETGFVNTYKVGNWCWYSNKHSSSPLLIQLQVQPLYRRWSSALKSVTIHSITAWKQFFHGCTWGTICRQ